MWQGENVKRINQLISNGFINVNEKSIIMKERRKAMKRNKRKTINVYGLKNAYNDSSSSEKQYQQQQYRQ